MVIGSILKRSFYNRDVVTVAKELLGKLLVRKVRRKLLVARIVETEAYGAQDDPASHAYRKKTERNAPMFGQTGRAYIYFTYGMHLCFNIVAHKKSDTAGGVLIRAIDPIVGVEEMLKARNIKEIEKLADGPGKLAQALQITKKLNKLDLTEEGPIYIVEDSNTPLSSIQATPRIGIRTAKDKKWRFVFK